MNDVAARVLVFEASDRGRSARRGVEFDLRLFPLKSSAAGIRQGKHRQNHEKFQALNFHL